MSQNQPGEPRPRSDAALSDRHAEIIARLIRWAASNDNIRAVIATGSSTRETISVDRFSDRDIEIVARDRSPLIEGDAWIHALAPVWVALYLHNDEHVDNRLVFFEGGRKLDFTITDRTRLDAMTQARQLNDLYERGYQVLLDKDELTSALPLPSGRPPRHSRPTEAEFAETVTEFWFEAAHMPTYLSRDELWVVKFRDWTMKGMMLRMLEWHALVRGGAETDVWHIGTKMKRWLDPATWADVQEIFGHFDRADSWRALTASMRLFARLSHEIATALDMPYPVESERAITAYVRGFEQELAGDET